MQQIYNYTLVHVSKTNRYTNHVQPTYIAESYIWLTESVAVIEPELQIEEMV